MKMTIGLRNSSYQGPKLPTSNGNCTEEIDEKYVLFYLDGIFYFMPLKCQNNTKFNFWLFKGGGGRGKSWRKCLITKQFASGEASIIVGGFGGMLPRKIFLFLRCFNCAFWCNLSLDSDVFDNTKYNIKEFYSFKKFMIAVDRK